MDHPGAGRLKPEEGVTALRAACRIVARNATERDDLFSEGLVILAELDYDGDWPLVPVLARKLLDGNRDRAAWARVVLGEPPEPAAREAEDVDDSGLDDILVALGPTHPWAPFIAWRLAHGQPRWLIAAECGCSPGRVSQIIALIRQRLTEPVEHRDWPVGVPKVRSLRCRRGHRYAPATTSMARGRRGVERVCLVCDRLRDVRR